MDDNGGSIEQACLCGCLDALVDEYLIYCHKSSSETVKEGDDKKSAKKNKNRFPNVAGFCRYFHIGSSEYETLAAKYPNEFDKLRVVFEDEAFNSEISPTLLSAYLKKRLGYEKNEGSEVYEGELRVVFDHDIMEDGG